MSKNLITRLLIFLGSRLLFYGAILSPHYLIFRHHDFIYFAILSNGVVFIHDETVCAHSYHSKIIACPFVNAQHYIEDGVSEI